VSEILCRRSIAKRLMGSVVVEAMGEGVDVGLEFVEAAWRIVGGLELVSLG
jgi:hypothetical protein